LGDRLPAQAGLTVGHIFMWYVYILKSSIKKWYKDKKCEKEEIIKMFEGRK
jgi:hypothetical protein